MKYELYRWSKALREHWRDPVDKLWWGWRFVVAVWGAATFFLGWIFFRILETPAEFSALIARGMDDATIAYGIIFVGYIMGFAILVSFKDRGYGPRRLFFGGLLLPAVVWTVLRGTVGL